MGVKPAALLALNCALAGLVIAGCAFRPRPAPADAGVYWPTYLGNYARTPFLHERAPGQRPEVVWASSVGSGIQGMPVVTDEVIVTARSDRHIETISRSDGTTYWRKRLDGPPVSPLLLGDVIYAATEEDGRLRALRLDEGDDIWKRDVPSIKRPITVAGDTVFAAAENGLLLALRSDRDPLWSVRLPRAASASPVVLDDVVLVVAHDSLFSLNRSSGLRRGSAHSREIFSGEAASDGEMLYLTTEDGSILAWAAPELGPRWRASGFGHFAAGPALADRQGYAVTREGQVLRFDPRTGAAETIAELHGTVLATPTIVENGILVGTLGGKLHFLSRDGDPIWDLELDGSIEAPVAVHEGRIIVPLYGRVDGPLGTTNLRGRLLELR